MEHNFIHQPIRSQFKGEKKMKHIFTIISLIIGMALMTGCGTYLTLDRSPSSNPHKSAPSHVESNAGNDENVARPAAESNPTPVIVDPNPCSGPNMAAQISTIGYYYTAITINGELVVLPPGTKTYEELHPSKP